ncbi:MAG: glycosyltransferase [Butyrivibrio sp.]|nr:glycosyltransferase [Butyrivibrio sp.]
MSTEYVEGMISVIITVYNREAFLEECVGSLVSQKEVLLEVLLIDDGSKDDSLKICNSLAKRYDSVRVFHQENSGISKARNTGLDNARGEFICFLDDDDVMTPGSLKVMLDAIRTYDTDIVVGNFERVGEDGHLVAESALPDNVKNRVITVDEFWEASFDKKGYFIFIVNWAKLYKRKIWEKLRFPEEFRNAEDEYVLADVLAQCKNIYVTDYIVHKQTVGNKSITRSGFSIVTLRAPETKLVTAGKLITQGKLAFAIKKWGIACGEIVTFTKRANTPEIKAELKRLYKWSCSIGKELFKDMDIKKKIKYLGYRFGYGVYFAIYAGKDA